MDEERKVSIETALQTYCERVKKDNLSLLQTVIDEAATLQTPAERYTSEEVSQKRRVRAIAKNCFGSPKAAGFPSTPQDLLANDDERRSLISRYSLDGVDHSPIDSDTRGVWLTILNNALGALNIETDVQPPERLPADFEYLCTLVDGICGPGLPSVDLQPPDFVVPVSEIRHEESSKTAARVSSELCIPDSHNWKMRPTNDLILNWGDDLSLNWKEWQMPLGVRIGDAEHSLSGTYALFCRRLKPADDFEYYYDEGEVSDEDKWKEGDDEWRWRYGMHDGEWQSPLSNGVEEFLSWYAQCKKFKLDDYRVTSLGLPEEAIPARKYLRD